MTIIGIFEDEYGLVPADPGRMIFIPNVPPAPPLPAIPSGAFQPPSNVSFLSIVTPMYIQRLSYGSISIITTFTFKGFTMGATYAFSCNGHTDVVSVSSVFDREVISWFDQDYSPKSTPENPSLTQIPLPLLIGNHADNPHVSGDDIVIKLLNGSTYICRGPVIAERSLVDEAETSMIEMLESQAQCFYLDSDVDGFNNL